MMEPDPVDAMAKYVLAHGVHSPACAYVERAETCDCGFWEASKAARAVSESSTADPLRAAARSIDALWDEPDAGTLDANDGLIWMTNDEPAMTAALRALRAALAVTELVVLPGLAVQLALSIISTGGLSSDVYVLADRVRFAAKNEAGILLDTPLATPSPDADR